MFKKPVPFQPSNRPANIPAPVGGLNAYTSLMSMPTTDAVLLDNWIPYPDRLEMRPGYAQHVTGFANTPYRLCVYSSGSGAETLFATTDAGIYDVTAGGAAGAPVQPLTNGKTSSTVIATGANTYLFIANGVDQLSRYDGSTWTTVSSFTGLPNTTILKGCETYRQRIFFYQRQSLILWFLASNAVTGTATFYDLGALFRQGGYIVSIGTWTIDGGAGPEDQLAVCTSKGEVAIFSGSDPSNVATWALRGVYYIGRPLGENCLFKYGGDLLFLSENGLYPLSQAMLSASIERTRSVTEKIRALFNQAARDFRANEGWQVIAQPDIPLLIVNVPSNPIRQQFVMHAQTGAWATFSGWSAYAFARMGSTLYYSTTNGINRVTGVNDNGGYINATMMQAYSKLGYPRNKQIVRVKPYFRTSGNFTYNLGVSNDFSSTVDKSTIIKNGIGTLPLWGTAIWGQAVWGGSASNIQEWQGVSDLFSMHKGLYMACSSLASSVEYIGSDTLYLPGGNFS